MNPITRRQFVSGMAASSAAIALGIPAHGKTRPNILFITADDMGPQAGCYGDTTIPTPRIDQLASQGIQFMNGYVTQASCSPSRSSMFTGLYPHQNGQLGLEHRGYTMHWGVPTLPGLLKGAGYRTCAVGKVHVRPYEELPFDTFVYGREQLDTRDVRAYERHIASFVDEAGDDPWFVLASFSDPHKPYRGKVEGLPETLLGPDDVKPFAEHGEFDTREVREEAAGYYNAVKRVDIGTGLLMDMLDRKGLAENTLVIFVGDHGPPVSRGKTTTYEFGTRIPYVVRWPGMNGGRHEDGFVSTTDIMPTCLEAAGVTMPAYTAGRSLSAFRDRTPSEWRNYLFTEFTTHGPGFAPQRAVRNARHKLIHNLVPGRKKNGIGTDGCPIRKMMTEPKWRETETGRVFQLMEDPPELEVYDLVNDPLEYTNLAGETSVADVEVELKSALMAWRKETHDPLLDRAYLEKLMAHTDAHLASYQAARDKAEKEGTKRPYNRIDMTGFQETFPTAAMR
jgi:N-sulfoglucosamine sulfohydrolase